MSNFGSGNGVSQKFSKISIDFSTLSDTFVKELINSGLPQTRKKISSESKAARKIILINLVRIEMEMKRQWKDSYNDEPKV